MKASTFSNFKMPQQLYSRCTLENSLSLSLRPNPESENIRLFAVDFSIIYHS